MLHNNKTYAIVAQSDIDALSQADRDFVMANVAQDSWDSTRKSLDETQLVLKWLGTASAPDNPLAVKGVTHTTYIHTEIKAEMELAAWKSTDSE